LGQSILVFGIRVGDVRLGFLELGLAELDDRAGNLSSWHSPGNANLPIGAVNDAINLFYIARSFSDESCLP
jgi:hypothetical protein